MASVLWLGPKTGLTDWASKKVNQYLNMVGLSINQVFVTSLHRAVPDMVVLKEKTQKKFIINPQRREAIGLALDKYIASTKPKLIVINDEATLWFLHEEEYTLNNCRGSVYMYKGVPCLVMYEMKNANPRVNREGNWVFRNDFMKLERWLNGRQRSQPKFRYDVCRTPEQVEALADYLTGCGKDIVVSEDIETVKRHISSVSFTYEHNGALLTVVVPFLNSLKDGYCHWESLSDEQRAWQAVGRIHAAENVTKIFHNGAAYDAAYWVKYHSPPVRFMLDTRVMFHSIWADAWNRLWFCASIVCDYYRFWKDENKLEEEFNFPMSEEGLERYWRYNALDTYFTYCTAVVLAKFLSQPSMEWARSNYNTAFKLQVGPGLMIQFNGMVRNQHRLEYYKNKWEQASNEALADLRKMVNDPEFNPNSSDQMATLLYDILGLKPLKGKGKNDKGDRSVDEKMLRIIKLQHPIADRIVETAWNVKKPKNNISKYYYCVYLEGRYLFSLDFSGTDTGRAAGKPSPFWVGTQPQNVPKKVRQVFQPDDGCFYAELDYSQSDAKFVAFECEDPEYIKTMDTPGLDTHSRHAEHFFGIPYQKIVDAHETEEDWVDHPIKGVRQNTKRVVHGSNFQMQAWTLYITMGKEAVVNMAKSLDAKISVYEAVAMDGKKERFRVRYHRLIKFDPASVFRNYRSADEVLRLAPDDWEQDDLVWICGDRLESYHKLYKGLRPWFTSSVVDAVARGNLATCAFGRTKLFFGDLANDDAIQRELSAYYGQGGTAGNINRVLNEVYYQRYNDLILKEGIRIITQTHDSTTFSIPLPRLDLVKPLLTIYEAPVTVKGRTFIVRADAKVGLNWGKMISWKPSTTVEDLVKNEEKVAKDFMLAA